MVAPFAADSTVDAWEPTNAATTRRLPVGDDMGTAPRKYEIIISASSTSRSRA